jgi:hypothetical protein
MRAEQIEAYRRDGFVFPLEIFSPAEVEGFRGAFESLSEYSPKPV